MGWFGFLFGSPPRGTRRRPWYDGIERINVAVMAFVVMGGIIFTVLMLWYLPNSNINKNATLAAATVHPSSNLTDHKRVRRNAVATNLDKHPCFKHYKGLELNFTGNATMYTVDLCDVIDCGSYAPSVWAGYDIYLCFDGLLHSKCPSELASTPWTIEGAYGFCPTWNAAVAFSGRWTPYLGVFGLSYQDNITRVVSLQRDYSVGNNPFTMTIRQWPFSNSVKHFWVVLGVDVSGTDPKGLIRVRLVDSLAATKTEAVVDHTKTVPGEKVLVEMDYTKLSPELLLEKATGYGDANLWLEWMISTARSQGYSECVACASGRPNLITEPAPLFPSDDPQGFACMTNLTKMRTPSNCSTISSIFPPVHNGTRPGPFTPTGGSYICFNFTSLNATTLVGEVDSAWCNRTLSGNDYIGSWARSGLFYYCGGRRMFTRIKPNTKGSCAMVRLAAPVMFFGHLTNHNVSHRTRRSIGSSFDLTVNSPTYIDAIGVPRGVPDEYKIADQVSAGFENIPVIAALFPITPNKNVDRINYVHYNVQRLANLTRDAVEGLAEQLAPTSLMAIQNRMALDMLLAEKGGVCSMFGDLCCTFIPNNTAPDGSVTRALEGLRTLSKTMAEQSGLDNPLDEWFHSVFGKWKSLILSILMALAVFVAILVTCGCCCIPCIRALCLRVIQTAVEKKDSVDPPPYSMPLLDMTSVPMMCADDDESEGGR